MVVFVQAQWILVNAIRSTGEASFLFTDYLPHVPLSEYSDSFSKYDKKLLLKKLPTAALSEKSLSACLSDSVAVWILFVGFLFRSNYRTKPSV